MKKHEEMHISGKSKTSEHREMTDDCSSVNFASAAGHWMRAGVVSRGRGEVLAVNC